MILLLKRMIAKIWAFFLFKKIKKQAHKAVNIQLDIFKKLIESGSRTAFGFDHDFQSIKTYEDFQKQVPIRDYEEIKSYINRVIDGEKNVLWNSPTIYFAKSSGTTSGVKYIPITQDSISNHIHTARTALLLYAHHVNANFLNGKMIFLSGSPALEYKGSIATGRLSGIVNHHIPAYLRTNQLPTWDTNLIEDWEEKVDAIVKETQDENMTLISGIPPWMIMYFDKLLNSKNKNSISELFINLQVIIYGGVNFDPYRETIFKRLGKSIDTLETYPASEGFLAFEAKGIGHEKGLLLNTNSGIFYEFISMDEIDKPNPKRHHLGEIELNKNYALILNSNAGLWGYSIGDTIKFVSKNPYLIKVTGRIKHFISAFGEHVIAEEVDSAILYASQKINVSVVEYHVAPQVNVIDGLPCHEWFVEFESMPQDLNLFSKYINEKLCDENIYYKDLIDGNILQTCKVYPLQENTFKNYMQSIGKLGGQNKLPRLLNHREIADKIIQYSI